MTGRFTVSGNGLHSGKPCTVDVTLHSDLPCSVFDTPDGRIDAVVSNICSESVLATDLSQGSARIRTVEHLLFALCAFRERAIISVTGPEVPILDGSAKQWVSLLTDAGATPGIRAIRLHSPVRVAIGNSVAEALPVSGAEQPEYCLEIDFNGAPVGTPRIVFQPFARSFSELAEARTFTLQSRVAEILQAGLGVGGGLDNTLIIGANGPVNSGGMRLPDEPVRHKLLDAIGDLSLLRGLPRAHLKLVRPGHRLIHSLARAIENSAPSPESRGAEF